MALGCCINYMLKMYSVYLNILQVSLTYQWQKIWLVTDIGSVLDIYLVVICLHFIKFNSVCLLC